MKCMMFGLACDKSKFNEIVSETNSPFSVAHYLFETAFIQEFEKYVDISHNFIYQRSNKLLSKAFVKKKCRPVTGKVFTHYLNYINLPIIRFPSLFISSCLKIRQFNKRNEDYFLLSTLNYFPVALATILMSKIYRKNNYIIFTDCSININRKNNFLRELYSGLVHKLENCYSGYILFSNEMNYIVNKKNNPSCVMEGILNIDGLDFSKTPKYNKFVILYAGTLMKKMGIENLIKAFKELNTDGIELWIAGDGPLKKDVIRLIGDNKAIKLLGYIDHAKLFEIEKRSSLLVNLRNPLEPYTWYSFPSKTFEYLASGTPFLSTKLKCYSEEYEDYIFFIENDEVNTIKNAINKLIALDSEKREEFGENAKKFVISDKTSMIQVKKVYKFIKLIEKGETRHNA